MTVVEPRPSRVTHSLLYSLFCPPFFVKYCFEDCIRHDEDGIPIGEGNCGSAGVVEEEVLEELPDVNGAYMIRCSFSDCFQSPEIS